MPPPVSRQHTKSTNRTAKDVSFQLIRQFRTSGRSQDGYLGTYLTPVRDGRGGLPKSLFSPPLTNVQLYGREFPGYRCPQRDVFFTTISKTPTVSDLHLAN